MGDVEQKQQGIGKTHRNRAGRTVRIKHLTVDHDFAIDRLRGDVGVATAKTAAQITK